MRMFHKFIACSAHALVLLSWVPAPSQTLEAAEEEEVRCMCVCVCVCVCLCVCVCVRVCVCVCVYIYRAETTRVSRRIAMCV